MQYPVHLHIKLCRGHNQEEQIQWQNELATANQIAEWLNNKLSPLPDGTDAQFDYYQIASDLNIEKAVVKRILVANSGGSNGVTLRK